MNDDEHDDDVDAEADDAAAADGDDAGAVGSEPHTMARMCVWNHCVRAAADIFAHCPSGGGAFFVGLASADDMPK